MVPKNISTYREEPAAPLEIEIDCFYRTCDLLLAQSYQQFFGRNYPKNVD